MPRTMFAAALPLLAVLALVPGQVAAGPPEGVSGRMVLEATRVRTSAGLVIIRQTPGGMAVEGPDFQGTAKRIVWVKKYDLLWLQGTREKRAILTKRVPGKPDKVVKEVRFGYSPAEREWVFGNLVKDE